MVLILRLSDDGWEELRDGCQSIMILTDTGYQRLREGIGLPDLSQEEVLAELALPHLIDDC